MMTFILIAISIKPRITENQNIGKPIETVK
jgi:hypothetical protein